MFVNLIKNIFKKMFSKNYFDVLLIYILFLLSSFILFFLVFGYNIVNLVKTNSLDTILNTQSLELLTLVFGSVILVILFSTVFFYLLSVFYVFLINKLSSKNTDLFFGLGSAFKKGILLFLGFLCLGILFSIIIFIISLIYLIPKVGSILFFIVFCLILFYAFLLFILFLGNIAKGISIFKSFKNSFSKLVSIKVFTSYFILLFIYLVLSVINYFISLIPYVGNLFSFLVSPLLIIYFILVIIELNKL